MTLPASPLAEHKLPLTAEVASGQALRLLADFGRVVAGLVQLEVSVSAGTIFDLCYVEDPLTGKEQGMFGAHNGTRYIARGRDDAFETFDVNGLRRIYMVIHGGAAR